MSNYLGIQYGFKMIYLSNKISQIFDFSPFLYYKRDWNICISLFSNNTKTITEYK